MPHPALAINFATTTWKRLFVAAALGGLAATSLGIKYRFRPMEHRQPGSPHGIEAVLTSTATAPPS
jgi:predicted MFS family arabinose efflux permease